MLIYCPKYYNKELLIRYYLKCIEYGVIISLIPLINKDIMIVVMKHIDIVYTSFKLNIWQNRNIVTTYSNS